MGHESITLCYPHFSELLVLRAKATLPDAGYPRASQMLHEQSLRTTSRRLQEVVLTGSYTPHPDSCTLRSMDYDKLRCLTLRPSSYCMKSLPLFLYLVSPEPFIIGIGCHLTSQKELGSRRGERNLVVTFERRDGSAKVTSARWRNKQKRARHKNLRTRMCQDGLQDSPSFQLEMLQDRCFEETKPERCL